MNQQYLQSVKAHLLLAPAAILGLFLSSCCGDELVCNEEGCFYCDGVDCRPATVDSRTACRGDFECQDGFVCTDRGCVATCSSENNQCEEDDLSCNEEAELCLFPGEKEPEPKPGTCTEPSDCGDADLLCLNGKCELDPSCPENNCECSSNDTCPDGFLCSLGRCQPDESTCRFDTDCSTNGTKLCRDGQCVEACTESDDPCSGARACNTDTGACEPEIRNECEQNSGCNASGLVCVNTNCVPECSTDENCADGEYCTPAGFCAADTRPDPSSRCTSDTECEDGGNFCIDGVCRLACFTPGPEGDLECSTQVTEFGNCILPEGDDRGICLPGSLAETNCKTSVDCTDGRPCWNGVCTE